MVRLPFATCLVPNHPLLRSSFTRVETYHWDFCINFAMRRWSTLTILLFFGLNPPITTNTLKALPISLGSSATCIAAIDHHPGEKAIGSMPLSVCSDSQLSTGPKSGPPPPSGTTLSRKVALHAPRPHVGELWRTGGYSGRTPHSSPRHSGGRFSVWPSSPFPLLRYRQPTIPASSL